MDAKKCDRCGAFYTGNRSNEERVGRVYVHLRNDAYPGSYHDDRDEYFDLCHNCMKAFREWMNREEENHDD